VALVERDNIDLFLEACWKFGVPSSSMFSTSDLYNKKDLTAVFTCLFSLSQLAPALGYKGKGIASRIKSKPGSAAASKPAKKVAFLLLPSPPTF
jgi:hypothetical protein